MKAKKLMEVALPIKEISAESVRDKSIRHGHISTFICGGHVVHCPFVVQSSLQAWCQIHWMIIALRLSNML